MCCLEYADMSKVPGFPVANPPKQNTSTAQAIQAWNLMGGALDWTALPNVSEYLEVQDLEILIENLQLIREYAERKRG